MDNEQKITPWEVKGKNGQIIDYDQIVTTFGCKKYDISLNEKIEKITGKKIHHFFTRNIVFAHRDFNKILTAVEAGKPIYLYTGRGPSSDSMHLGHAIPFLICKFFQDTFKVPVVIQMTDDEKFLWKNISLEESRAYCESNIRDIIAFGFDSSLTYIFSNLLKAHLFEHNTIRISKAITFHEASKVFGFNGSSSIGQIQYPAKQIAPCFPSSFKTLCSESLCLVPAAVDQDPYFRLARDKASLLGENKPASIYVSLLPDLKGVNRKMSASDPNSSIYLTDDPNTIKKKIRKYAFSGGKETLEDHRKYGGNPDIDVSFQYIRYFCEDSEVVENYRKGYLNGSITSKEMKDKCIEIVTKFVEEYQVNRNNITEDVVKKFTSNEL